MVKNLRTPEPRLFTVLHLKHDQVPRGKLIEATFQGAVGAISDLYSQGLYEKVAVVRTDNLNQALMLTGSPDGVSWTDNPGVGPYENARRSTTIGDIFVVDEDEVYVVTDVGFELLPVIARHDHVER